MTCSRYRQAACGLLVGGLALATASCGDTVRQGRSPAYLIIDRLVAASGAQPDDYSNTLGSDVITNVKTGDVYVSTFYEDPAFAEMHIAMKDIGTTLSPTEPSSNNFITVNRYRVSFKRADGRNTPGVDVPYAFDGAATGTIGPSTTALDFILVRAQAKKEAPLAALRGGGGALMISTVAEVTFYGRDQVGNETSVTGQISVNFADWGDPQQ